jgi:hypothetical protein
MISLEKKSSQKVKEKERLQVLIQIKSKVTPTSHCQIFRCAKREIVISTCISLELPRFRIDIIIRGIHIIADKRTGTVRTEM